MRKGQRPKGREEMGRILVDGARCWTLTEKAWAAFGEREPLPRHGHGDVDAGSRDVGALDERTPGHPQLAVIYMGEDAPLGIGVVPLS